MASSLDSNAQAATQVLLGQLNYKLPATASYVLDRASSVFLTTGAGTFAPTGVRTFRIPINSDGQWADLNTLTLSFTIKNRSGNALAVLVPKTDGPWSLVQRMRIYVSGTVVEDLQWYGRIHEAFYQLSSPDMQRTEATRSFLFQSRNNQPFQRVKIATGRTHTVSLRPLSGLIQSGKFFPVQWCPIQIEIELADAVTTWMSTNGAAAVPGLLAGPETCTRDYELLDCKVNVDMITLDSGMNEEFAKLMESGSSLPLNITTFAHFSQATLGTNPTVPLTRACAKIRDLMWSFTRRQGVATLIPGGIAYDDQLSWCNDFYYPKATDVVNGFASDAEMYETRWTLGAKGLGPVQNFRYFHEYLHQLYEALGYLNDTKALPDLDRETFLSEKHICAVTLERALNVAMTGLSSRSGSLLALQLYNLAPNVAPACLNAGELAVNQAWVVIMHEIAVTLSKYGVQVAD